MKNNSKRTFRKEPQLMTEREFRRGKEEKIRFMMKTIQAMAAVEGFRIKNRIEFEDIQTGETFR